MGSSTWTPAASVLAGCLATSCSLLADSQVSSLDLASLTPSEGYVVGTITTVERFDDGQIVVLLETPDIRYDVIVTPAGTSFRSGFSPRIRIDADAGPVLFALKLPAGPHRMAEMTISNDHYSDGTDGNYRWAADIDHVFDVQPGSITYLGDVRFQVDTEQVTLQVETFLFNPHPVRWKFLTTAVREDRALLDRLMGVRFPDAHPGLHIALAQAESEGETWRAFQPR